jgi:iron(III) transport system permease protein
MVRLTRNIQPIKALHRTVSYLRGVHLSKKIAVEVIKFGSKCCEKCAHNSCSGNNQDSSTTKIGIATNKARTLIQIKKPYQASGAVGWLISLFVLGVFMLSFALPMLQLVVWGWESVAQEWSVKYFDLIASTSILTISAALITVVIATILALPSHCKQSGIWLKSVIRLATLGYALPGSVMAVGLLYGVNQVSQINIYLGGESINYLIFGSIALLLFAYVSRFMAIAYSSIEASTQQIKPVFIQSARLLGVSRLRLIWQVYLPMMIPGILAGGLLVAVDVMKELPATYLLRPFGWDTLAIQVYELSSEGLFERASVPALIMVLFGSILMLIFQVLDKKTSFGYWISHRKKTNKGKI